MNDSNTYFYTRINPQKTIWSNLLWWKFTTNLGSMLYIMLVLLYTPLKFYFEATFVIKEYIYVCFQIVRCVLRPTNPKAA